MISCIRTDTYLSFKVRADPDNTSLHSHLEGEADDPSNLQQRLLTKAPSSLTTNNKQMRCARPTCHGLRAWVHYTVYDRKCGWCRISYSLIRSNVAIKMHYEMYYSATYNMPLRNTVTMTMISSCHSVVRFCCSDSDAAHQRPSVCCNVIWLGASFLQSSIQVQSQRPAV